MDSFITDLKEFTTDELDTLLVTSRIISGISIFGLLLVHIVFWFFKSIRTFAFELVAWLCFSSMMFNISFFFRVYPSDNLNSYLNGTLSISCGFQSFLNILFDLSSMMWTTIIGYTAYISVAKQEHLDNNKMKYRIGFILITFILPLIFALM